MVMFVTWKNENNFTFKNIVNHQKYYLKTRHQFCLISTENTIISAVAHAGEKRIQKVR